MTEVIYLHIPKTGGTYVARNDDVISPINDLNHSAIVTKSKPSPYYPPSPGYLESMRKDISILTGDRICFATVRNPFSWLVSYWFHAGCDIPESEKPSHYDYTLARKGFKEFVTTIANRDVGWPSNKFIHFAIFCYDGDLIVDRLVHQDNLDAELKELAEDYGLQYRRGGRVRVSEGAKDYRTYYDDNLIDLVQDTWGRELSLFGYDFDGKIDGVLGKVITAEQKEDIKYFWATDTFIRG